MSFRKHVNDEPLQKLLDNRLQSCNHRRHLYPNFCTRTHSHNHKLGPVYPSPTLSGHDPYPHSHLWPSFLWAYVSTPDPIHGTRILAMTGYPYLCLYSWSSTFTTTLTNAKKSKKYFSMLCHLASITDLHCLSVRSNSLTPIPSKRRNWTSSLKILWY